MSRSTLTDEQGDWIAGYPPGREGRERSGPDNRLFVDAIQWMAGNAASWSDLPQVVGKSAGYMRGSGAGRMPVSGNGFSSA